MNAPTVAVLLLDPHYLDPLALAWLVAAQVVVHLLPQLMLVALLVRSFTGTRRIRTLVAGVSIALVYLGFLALNHAFDRYSHSHGFFGHLWLVSLLGLGRLVYLVVTRVGDWFRGPA